MSSVSDRVKSRPRTAFWRLPSSVLRLDVVRAPIARLPEEVPRLGGVEGVRLEIGIRVLRSLEEGDLAEVLVVHQVLIQPVEVEQVLHRLAEGLILEDRRLEIHVEAVGARRDVCEDARPVQPAVADGVERVLLVPGPRGVFHDHVEFAAPQVIQRPLWRDDTQVDLVEVECALQVALVVTPPCRFARERDRFAARHFRHGVGTDGDLILVIGPCNPVLVEHHGVRRRRPQAGIVGEGAPARTRPHDAQRVVRRSCPPTRSTASRS